MSNILKPVLGNQLQLSHPLAQGLVGLWLFNEGTGGKVFDSSGNGNTGTLSGVSWTAGRFGSATQYDAATDYIACGNPTGLSTDELTAVIWVNRPALTGGDFYSKGTYYGVGFGFRADADADIRVSVGNQAVISTGALPANEWTMFVLSYKKDSWGKLYKNGLFTDNLSACTASITHTKQITIGNNENLNAGLVCTIDRALYFDRGLSASEIVLLYREPFCMFERDPIELWSAATLGVAPPVGMAGAMTTNSGYWGW